MLAIEPLAHNPTSISNNFLNESKLPHSSSLHLEPNYSSRNGPLQANFAVETPLTLHQRDGLQSLQFCFCTQSSNSAPESLPTALDLIHALYDWVISCTLS